ncbi:MAG: nuclear transport factor 2 family protein [Burkholderiales bacterium]|nr:nuclear transport factor 2 family protein [Burkholderiales bacterium]
MTVHAAPVLSASGDNVGAWMSALLAAVDARDTPRFLPFLTEDAAFRFANHPPATGRAEVGAAVSAFLGSIREVRHEIDHAWAPAGHAICQGTVTYTRVDGSTLTVPFANVFAMRDGRIRDYRIYVDASALYAPT